MSTFAGPSVVQALDATLARARRRWRRRRLLRALAIVAAVLMLGTALGTSVAAAFIGYSVRAGEGPGPGLAAAIVAGTAAALFGWVLAPRLRRTRRAEAPASA